jgi:aryl-alcohol dehydrogenase-like predicted oxidoreductase
MEYRKFGQTDLTVSVLGCGCWDASVQQTAGGGGYSDRMSAAIHRALELGITCFDTAPVYGGGASERMLGKTLGAHRKDVVVVTKCGFGFEGSAEGRPKGRDARRESILPLVESSLQRLNTDYVDLLLCHFPDTSTPFEETMGAMDTLVQQGKVRAIGVSNFSLDQLKQCHAIRPIDVVQYQLNMFDRRMEPELFPYCQQQGIGVMIWGSMASGLLAGAFTADTTFGNADWRAKGDASGEIIRGQYANEVFQRNVRLVDELKPIAANRGKKMAQMALRWVLSNPAVSVALVGTINTQELEENLGVLEWAISEEDMRRIDGVFDKYGVDTHLPMLVDP